MNTHLIREYLQVDPNSPTGLSWKKHKPNTTSVVGAPAGTSLSSKGYYTGRLGPCNYKSHRVVFYLTRGYWPVQVDHIDGVRTNNTPENLRAADSYSNQHNRVCNGYYLEKSSGKYKAYIRTGGKFKTLGRFSSAKEARAAYLAAKQVHHPTAPERCYVS